MNPTKFRSPILVASSSLMGLLFFVLGDYFFGYRFMGPNLQIADKPYLSLEHGWYELKRNFTGKDNFGPFVYPVSTDSYGFRKADTADVRTKYDIIFLGDSFTYGVNGPWDQTFVGMFEKQSGARVLNAGVGSYSPTPYLYQYKRALEGGLLANGHSVVIGIDISDVQDEAAYWVWDEKKDPHPRKMMTNFSDQASKKSELTLREKIRDALPMTVTLYRFIRYRLINSSRDPLLLSLMDTPRSAFTWESWQTLDKTHPQEVPSGYAPLGVERGLSKISERVLQISDEAKKYRGNVYLLIYPWPAQIIHQDKFNWSAWVEALCVKASCMGVIDTIPHFRELAKGNSNWFIDYYMQGDIHFNKNGNQVIAEHLLKNKAFKPGAQ